MLFLGIDLGTSSIKVSVVDGSTQKAICTTHYPEQEANIISKQVGWAEQDPHEWWQNTKKAILKLHSTKKYNPKDIVAIGISYQMHGLVLVDKNLNVLRNAIIWCDSRAIEIGNTAFQKIGREKCLTHLLNSPANFTASKLAWVKQNEPEIYKKVEYFLLPGDFISLKLTGIPNTTISALSEGIFWDFQNDRISDDILKYFDFNKNIFPSFQPSIANHGIILKNITDELSLSVGVTVSYKAGDQPNNALSLNVLNHGEVAATAGTSGVIYAVSDKLTYDPKSRVNSFAHINYEQNKKNIGVLLCINGVGILYSWLKNQLLASRYSYEELNNLSTKVSEGADGLRVIPFGNGAERILENKLLSCNFHGINFNIHKTEHIIRAISESIVFAFRLGIDILRENKIDPKVMRVGNSNLFLSPLFKKLMSNNTQTTIEIYENDGSIGAALGAGIGNKFFKNTQEAFVNFKPLEIIYPQKDNYQDIFEDWKDILNKYN